MAVDVKGALTQRIGPLPAYAYAIVVVAGIWLAYWWRNRNASPELDSFSELGLGAGDVSGHIDDTGLDNVPAGGTGGGSVVTPDSDPTTNAQWLALSLEYLESAYGFDRDDIIIALNKILRGDSLTVAEWTMKQLAIARFGAPPEGVAPPSVDDDDDVPSSPAPSAPSSPAPSTAPNPTGYSIVRGTNLNQFIDQVRAGQLSGMTSAIPGYSHSVMLALNTWMRIYWAYGTGDGPYGKAYSDRYGKIAYLDNNGFARIR